MKDLTPMHLRCIPFHQKCPCVAIAPDGDVYVTGPNHSGEETTVMLGLEYFSELAKLFPPATPGTAQSPIGAIDRDGDKT